MRAVKPVLSRRSIKRRDTQRVLLARIEQLRSALITAVQWMPSPGTEYTEDAKADVKQVQEALGWIEHQKNENSNSTRPSFRK